MAHDIQQMGYRFERIVDLVRDAGCEPSYRRQLLRTQQRLLGELTVGDVDVDIDAKGRDCLTGFARHGLSDGRDPVKAAVRSNHPELVDILLPA